MNNAHNTDDLDISLVDIYQFLKDSKKYCLIGVALGLLFSSIYLMAIKPIYQSKVVIDLNTGMSIPGTPAGISADEIKDRLQFATTQEKITKKISLQPNSQEALEISKALNSSKLIAGRNFLEISLMGSSENATEKLLSSLTQELINTVIDWNQPRINYLKKVQENNRVLLAQTKDLAAMNALQATNFNIELLINTPELLLPKIIDGPSHALQVNQQSIFITLIKGLLLGLSIALGIAFLRKQWHEAN